jgi:Tfp pilus assembly protein PilV
VRTGKTHNPSLRKAIAMIELIFAITVMGIVMLSAPMLINRATQSSYVAMQQESIAAVAAQINMIMAAEWDAADTNISVIGEPVLSTFSTTFNPCTGTVDRPAGVTSSSGRYCKGLDNSYGHSASTTLGLEGTEGTFYDDIDDYHNAAYQVTVYNSETYQTYEGDYIDRNITLTSQVYYGDDVPRKADNTASTGGYDQNITFSNPFRNTSTTSTNIKLITVTLSSANTADELRDKNIRLSAFMCNIGAPKPDLISNAGDL